MKIIVEKDLILRPVKLSDASDFFAFASQEEITKYLSYFPHKNLEETKNIIEKMFLPLPEIGKLIIEKDNVVIGTCDIRHREELNEEDNLEHFYNLGYQLNPQYWGNQIMTKCVKALLNYFFKKYPQEKIFVHAFIDNIGSWKVIKKTGFLPSNRYMSVEKTKKLYPKIENHDYTKEERQIYYHDLTTWKTFLEQDKSSANNITGNN